MAKKNKKDREKLDKQIMFRVTAEECNAIKAGAAEAGLTMSAFIRQIQTKNKPVFDNRVKAEYVRQLTAIGTNFNQIVRGFHMKSLPAPAELVNIRMALDRLHAIISSQK